jgi:hypothetical protein
MGVILNGIDEEAVDMVSFVPSCSFRPPRADAADLRRWEAVDSHHCRVLLCYSCPWTILFRMPSPSETRRGRAPAGGSFPCCRRSRATGAVTRRCCARQAAAAATSIANADSSSVSSWDLTVTVRICSPASTHRKLLLGVNQHQLLSGKNLMLGKLVVLRRQWPSAAAMATHAPAEVAALRRALLPVVIPALTSCGARPWPRSATRCAGQHQCKGLILLEYATVALGTYTLF